MGWSLCLFCYVDRFSRRLKIWSGWNFNRHSSIFAPKRVDTYGIRYRYYICRADESLSRVFFPANLSIPNFHPLARFTYLNNYHCWDASLPLIHLMIGWNFAYYIQYIKLWWPVFTNFFLLQKTRYIIGIMLYRQIFLVHDLLWKIILLLKCQHGVFHSLSYIIYD